MASRQIFLDLDGVLADFDRLAGAILGTDNIYKWEFVHGSKAFWDKLNSHKDFFRSLELKSDAARLWKAVRHLEPTILTALPKTDAEEVDRQKRDWVARHLGPYVPVATCVTSDKPKFCQPGDVLIDDRAVNREAWTKAGGAYILHTHAETSIVCLEALGYI